MMPKLDKIGRSMFCCRMSPADRKFIREAAKRAGLPIQDYVVRSCRIVGAAMQNTQGLPIDQVARQIAGRA